MELEVDDLDAPLFTPMDLPLAPPPITTVPKPDHLPWCARLQHLNPRTRIDEAQYQLGVFPHQLAVASILIKHNPVVFTETGALRLLPGSAFNGIMNTVRKRLIEILDEQARSAMEIDGDHESDEQSYVLVGSAGTPDLDGRLHLWDRERALRKLVAAMIEVISYYPAEHGSITDHLRRPLLEKTSLRLVGPKPTPKPRYLTINSDLPLRGEVSVWFPSIVDHDATSDQMIVDDIDIHEVRGVVKQSLLGGRSDPFQFSWEHPELGRMTVLDAQEFVQAMKVMHMAMKGREEDAEGGKDFVFQVEMMPK